jgi:hypothetical protein
VIIVRRNKLKPDDECSVGTGALIIFIATILLASIISFTIIRISEEISQKTQNTAEDVRRNSVNSVIITGAWVYDNQDDMLFMMEFGAAGEPVSRLDVIYVLTCTEPDGTFHYRSAALGDSQGGSAIYVWEVGDQSPVDNPTFTNVNNFQPGARYFFTLDGGTQTSPGGAAGECGPPHLDTHGIDANLFLHIPNGQSTHQLLSLSNGREIGSQII